MNSAWDRHANVWFISSSSKNSLLNGMKILWDLKILWKTGSEGPKFGEILSHSVRYGMYESTNLNIYKMYHMSGDMTEVFKITTGKYEWFITITSNVGVYQNTREFNGNIYKKTTTIEFTEVHNSHIQQ